MPGNKKTKRDPASVIMPDDSGIGNNSRISTDTLPINSVSITDKKKAQKITYSLHPKIIEAVEKYAEDNFMPKSQVVAQAIKNLIPPEYFQ